MPPLVRHPRLTNYLMPYAKAVSNAFGYFPPYSAPPPPSAEQRTKLTLTGTYPQALADMQTVADVLQIPHL